MRYFDHSATTPLHPKVLDLISEIEKNTYGNPSSTHRLGKTSRVVIETDRKQLADSIGCTPFEIIFTGGGTEANNLVLWNLLFQKKKHIITSAIEHPAILNVILRLKEFGVTSTILPVDRTGRVRPDELALAITEETGLITIMTANNETGVLQPLNEICEIADKHHIPFHSDGVQTLGKISVSVKDLGVDMMSFSAHKFYGPKGVGALYINKNISLKSLIIGGGQERKLRAGTENISGIAGLGLAAEIAAKTQSKFEDHLNQLSQQFQNELTQKYSKAIYNNHPQHGLPGVVSVTIPDITSDMMTIHLDMKGFAVSSGSACSSGVVKPSHVLKAMGVSNDNNIRTIRISFGKENTLQDVKDLVNAIVQIIENQKRRR